MRQLSGVLCFKFSDTRYFTAETMFLGVKTFIRKQIPYEARTAEIMIRGLRLENSSFESSLPDVSKRGYLFGFIAGQISHFYRMRLLQIR
jgi:hypothetical protein